MSTTLAAVRYSNDHFEGIIIANLEMEPVLLKNETIYEYYQDISLGTCFLLISIVALVRTRLYFDPWGQGRVITTFNLLMFFTGLIRSIWFLIPSYILEGSYVPEPIIALESDKWIGCIVSELLLLVGSLLLYSQFILLALYWSYILLNTAAPRTAGKPGKKEWSPMSSFTLIMATIVLLECANITLFIMQIFNSQEMIIYDSIMLSILSIGTLTAVCVYSSRIRTVMGKVSKLNRYANVSSAMTIQSRRIFQITVGAFIFFAGRVSVELSFAIVCLRLMYGKIMAISRS